MMITSPQIVHTQDELYAFIHLVIPRSEMHTLLPPTLHELFAAVGAQGLPIVPWFAHHLNITDSSFDFEVCLPVAETFVTTGRIKTGTWRAGTVARVIYHGDYPGLPAAWGELHTWIAQSGYVAAGHMYERYTLNRGNTADSADNRTELSWPLVASAAKQEQA